MIAYTFGVYPPQQYLITLPGGRYQALGIAWDSRPKQQGAQRWFDLPEQQFSYYWLAPTDTSHWEMNPDTGIARRTEKPSSTELETCAACNSRRKVIANNPPRRALPRWLPSGTD